MNVNERKCFLLFSVATGKGPILLITKVLNKIAMWILPLIIYVESSFAYTKNAFICVHLRSFAFSFSFKAPQPCNH